MAVVDNAVYVDGCRHVEPPSLEETYELLREQQGMGWIGLYRPDPHEVRSVAAEFGIHDLAVEDTISAHQRPKLERYGDVLFTVLRPARYIEADERVEFGELHVFTGADFIVTVRHAESPNLGGCGAGSSATPTCCGSARKRSCTPSSMRSWTSTLPVVDGLENDIDEIEDQVFAGDPEVSRRIYELFREVVEFQRATKPLLKILSDLSDGFEKYQVDEEMQRYLRDVQDHTIRIVERVDGFRALLQNILTVNSTLVAQRQNDETQRLTETSLRQNEEVKKISAWAAILFAPTLVGTDLRDELRAHAGAGVAVRLPDGDRADGC